MITNMDFTAGFILLLRNNYGTGDSYEFILPRFFMQILSFVSLPSIFYLLPKCKACYLSSEVLTIWVKKPLKLCTTADIFHCCSTMNAMVKEYGTHEGIKDKNMKNHSLLNFFINFICMLIW